MEQARIALIGPELLRYATQALHGDPGRIQETIDRDLLGLLPPVEARGHRERPPCQEARKASARRRAQYSCIQALYCKSCTACARTVLAGQWKLARQTAYWKPLFKNHQARRAASHPGPGPCGTWYVPSLTKKWLGVDSSGVLPPPHNDSCNWGLHTITSSTPTGCGYPQPEYTCTEHLYVPKHGRHRG